MKRLDRQGIAPQNEAEKGAIILLIPWLLNYPYYTNA
jgi:hypothetical protein